MGGIEAIALAVTVGVSALCVSALALALATPSSRYQAASRSKALWVLAQVLLPVVAALAFLLVVWPDLRARTGQR